MLYQPPPKSNVAAFFATAWGKVIGALAVISMLLGIYIEFTQAVRGTYDAAAAKSDAQIKASQAAGATQPMPKSRPVSDF